MSWLSARRLAVWLPASAVGLVYACVLSSSDQYSNGVCPAGQKACSTKCVSMDDPDYGCASDDCAACNLERASARCSAGACVISACYPGRADCNGNPVDGCETDLNTGVDTCGSCQHRCASNNAVAVCNNAECAIALCFDGFGNCNGTYSDGCETNFLLEASCGACGSICKLGERCERRVSSIIWSAHCVAP